MQLVLFAIDGTQLTSGKAGADAMRQAFAELYCIPDGFAEISFAGKTDPLILQEALAHHGWRARHGPIPFRVQVLVTTFVGRCADTLHAL